MGINDRDSWKFTAADKLYDAAIAAQVSAPTFDDETDGVEINSSGKRGPRYLNFSGLIRNAADDDEGTTAIWLWPFFYFAAEDRWFPASGIKFHLQSEVLADTNGVKGNCYQVVKPAGATRVAWATDANPAAGNKLHLVVERDT